MSKERELLKKALDFMLDAGANLNPLFKEINDNLLDQPEPIKERERYQKIISTDDACNWNLIVGALKDYDHVYVNGIRYTEFQPKHEPLRRVEIIKLWRRDFDKWSCAEIDYDQFCAVVKEAEKAHGIGGG